MKALTGVRIRDWLYAKASWNESDGWCALRQASTGVSTREARVPAPHRATSGGAKTGVKALARAHFAKRMSGGPVGNVPCGRNRRGQRGKCVEKSLDAAGRSACATSTERIIRYLADTVCSVCTSKRGLNPSKPESKNQFQGIRIGPRIIVLWARVRSPILRPARVTQRRG
jgi:hypothetical protein